MEKFYVMCVRNPALLRKEQTMILHPLTKELLSVRSGDLLSPDRDEVIDKVVRGYLTSRLGLLETGLEEYGYDSFYNTAKTKLIKQAFQLAPETKGKTMETLRDKFVNSISASVLFQELEEHGIIDMFVCIAEEHFRNQPSVRTVNYSVPQSGGTY